MNNGGEEVEWYGAPSYEVIIEADGFSRKTVFINAEKFDEINVSLAKADESEMLARYESMVTQHGDKRLLFLITRDVVDLEAVAKMDIDALYLNGSNVADLSPLTNSSLTELSINVTDVRDLTPLTHMKIERLDMIKAQVDNIDSLRNTPIKELRMQHSKVRDLSPLFETDIETIYFSSDMVTNGIDILKKFKQVDFSKWSNVEQWERKKRGQSSDLSN